MILIQLDLFGDHIRIKKYSKKKNEARKKRNRSISTECETLHSEIIRSCSISTERKGIS